MKKVVAIAVLLAALVTCHGQTTKQDKKDEPAPVILKGTLPRGWAKLGLSDKQKKEVLLTRSQFAAKRQALEDQLRALKAEEDEALAKLLTDSQRSLLKTQKGSTDSKK